MTAVATRVRRISLTDPKTIGIGGIVLGGVAFWLALPPLAARMTLWPIVIGILAIAAGIWAQSREQRRLGWGAIVAGLLGIALGVLAPRSSTAHLDQVVVWSALGGATLRYATPLTDGAIRGLYCEESRVGQVALEGMLLSAVFFRVWTGVFHHLFGRRFSC